MLFKDIEGNILIKNSLIRMVNDNRISHALLFNGPEGNAKIQLALAFARYLNCENPTTEDSCGECKSCKWFDNLTYPDLHFFYPTANTKTKKLKEPCSEDFIEEWRDIFLEKKGIFSFSDWTNKLEIDSGNLNINSKDCNNIIKDLSYSSFKGRYKVVFIWLPEKIYYAAAPKILKILEEPPKKTVFILITEQKELILDTILSRVQEVKVPPFSKKEVKNVLQNTYNISSDIASNVAEMSSGNITEDLYNILNKDSEDSYFKLFIDWMRLCYSAKMLNIIPFVDSLNDLGREKNILFLKNTLVYLHQALFYNETNKFISQIDGESKIVFTKFARFITRNNIGSFYKKIQDSIVQIQRNGYVPLIMMNLTLELCRVIRKY